MLIDWFTVGRAGAQLPHPGVVDEAISLQADPQRHRRAGEADRRGTGGRRREKGRGPKGARRIPAQERGVRPAARRTLSKATDEAKAERQRLLDEARKDADALRAKRQESLRNEQQQARPRNHPLDPERSLCHRAQDTGGPRRRRALRNAWARCSSNACGR